MLDSLDDFLLPATVEMLQDIYVIGVQECYMDRYIVGFAINVLLNCDHALKIMESTKFFLVCHMCSVYTMCTQLFTIVP